MPEGIVVKREDAVVAQSADLLSIIAAAAIDPRCDVEKMERLLAMQERVVADRRKQAFEAAMTRLQAVIPQINKYGQGKNSKFAKLEDIDIVIRPLLAGEGFNVTFDEESHTEKTVTFVMKIAHQEGHSESKRMTVPIDAAAKNREGNSIRPAIQDAGSTVSYARRYLLKMHFNLVETNEDTDGNPTQVITAEQAMDIRTLLQDTKSDEKKFLELIAGADKIENILVRDLRRVMNALESKARGQK